ncbi:MAG: hypothetical protein ABL949_14520 [Fimbriimonadaceae bacterium]
MKNKKVDTSNPVGRVWYSFAQYNGTDPTTPDAQATISNFSTQYLVRFTLP